MIPRGAKRQCGTAKDSAKGAKDQPQPAKDGHKSAKESADFES
ncbi:hypothetical protein ACFOZY_07725 [Chungangia koreensis]|uniref:Uncharacterized protein n=1 Tax=Chungangia koreensis TaxID=752657 RepID=A0ABV8X581_9LACT